MPAFTNRTSWYTGLSAYWFATSLKWFILLSAVLPGQVSKIVPGGEQNRAWGAVFAIGAAWAVIGPSLFGYLSDRMGHRRVWLALGSGLTVIALMVLLGANSLAMLTIGYLLLQISDDVGTGPYAASIPELVPPEHRGRASGTMSVLQLTAQIFIAILAFAIGSEPATIYTSVAVINVVCALWTITTLKGAVPLKPKSADADEPNLVAGFIRGWIDPWKHRDFFWVWFTRFLNALGFYLIQPYLRFYLTDRVAEPDGKFRFFSLTLSDAGLATVALSLVISLFGAMGSIWAARAADRLGRKKLIYLGGMIMASVLVPFALFPNYTIIMLLGIGFGVGYGLYLSADWALVSDVLPNSDTLGSNMGVWSMSVTSVQIVTGSFGRVIDRLNASSPGMGYTGAILVAAGAFFLSTVLIRQVRGSH